MTARSFRVKGVVQGVGFRWAAQEEAQRRGLAGWVRNEENGEVSGFVQGEEASVEAFGNWLKRGPRSAQVTNRVWLEAPTTALRLFTVR